MIESMAVNVAIEKTSRRMRRAVVYSLYPVRSRALWRRAWGFSEGLVHCRNECRRSQSSHISPSTLHVNQIKADYAVSSRWTFRDCRRNSVECSPTLRRRGGGVGAADLDASHSRAFTIAFARSTRTSAQNHDHIKPLSSWDILLSFNNSSVHHRWRGNSRVRDGSGIVNV